MWVSVRICLTGILAALIGLGLLALSQHLDPYGISPSDPNALYVELAAYGGVLLLVAGFGMTIVGGILALVIPKEKQ